MFDNLDDDNFLMYAAKNYVNPQCHGMDEFFSDVKRFKYIKRLFGKYERSGDLKERLILNHLVVIYNVFGDSATRMLFFKMDGYYEYLKPFLVLLERLPKRVVIGPDQKIWTDSISLDAEVIKALRSL